MATLRFVRDAKDSRLLLLGIVEKGESANYTVNLSAYSEIGAPSVGEELDDDQMSVIRHIDELLRAKKKALNILAYADNNKKNLVIKLRRAGFGREIADEVCREMVELGYINESDQLRRLITDEANRKLRGPMRILPALATKGYSTAQIKETMSDLVRMGEIDFHKNAAVLLSKKLHDGANEEEKKTILYKNGYKI